MIGFIIWVLFVILYLIIKPISFIYTVIFRSKSAANYWYKSGQGLDSYINHDCYSLLNFMLIKKTANYRFGKISDTMSYVLGINETSKNLTWLGVIWVYLLWPFCPFRYWEVGHCQWAVQTKYNTKVTQ